ncbi:hypothetical protein G6F43_013804 [Rhizopus delemar]|nr:hypothetical protein G6F43_013804 [Rhizopus delemar]
MFRLVVCPECHTLYQPEEVHCDSKCTFSEFRITCNAPLFKPATIGASKMYANKVSAFNSIKYALTVMFSRPGFESAIEAWRYRTRHNNTIYSRSQNCCKESIFLGFCSAHPVTMAQTASVPT